MEYCFSLIDISSLLNLQEISGRISFNNLFITDFYGLGNIDYNKLTSIDLRWLPNLNNINAEGICNFFINGVHQSLL